MTPLKYAMLNLYYNDIKFMLDSHVIIYYTLELTASEFMAHVNQGIFHYFPKWID